MPIHRHDPLDLNDADAEQFLKNLQGNILKGHGRNRAAHVFLDFHGAEVHQAKQWITTAARSRFTSAFGQQQQTDSGATGHTLTTFSMSAEGYKHLGLEIPDDKSFRKGMRERGSKLNDPAPQAWEPAYATPADRLHALVIIANEDETKLANEVATLRAEIEGLGASVVHVEPGNQLRNADGEAIEHFGYRDGVSQPNFFVQTDADDNPDFDQTTRLGLVLEKKRGFDNAFGSYLVFRKLEQDVRGFNEAVERVADQLGMNPDLAGAMAVGRFKDGTPVVKHAQAQGSDGDKIDFDFDDDPKGRRCPFHAHIRKANPRNEVPLLINIVAQEQRRRIARRGITYGVRGDTDATSEPPSGGVGLLFMCYQSDIRRQFEFIQRRWANNPDFLKSNTGPDPVIAQGDDDEHDEEDWPNWPQAWGSKKKVRIPFGEFVSLRGGEYFYTPSLPFLLTLAD